MTGHRPESVGTYGRPGRTPVAYVAVVGPGRADAALRAKAHEAGRLLAGRGVVVLTGGLGGVMGAAAQGVRAAGGTAVALLPGLDRAAADPAHTLALTTGLGEMRNALLVRAADAVLCLGGSWGTLSEVALAVRTGVPVVAVDGWALPEPGVAPAGTVAEAVAALLGDPGPSAGLVREPRRPGGR